MTKRPPILTKNGKLHENVKGLIFDRNKKLIGVVLVTEKNMIIEFFFGKACPVIVYDKKTKKFDLDAELFPKNPRNYVEKKIGWEEEWLM